MGARGPGTWTPRVCGLPDTPQALTLVFDDVQGHDHGSVTPDHGRPGGLWPEAARLEVQVAGLVLTLRLQRGSSRCWPASGRPSVLAGSCPWSSPARAAWVTAGPAARRAWPGAPRAGKKASRCF